MHHPAARWAIVALLCLVVAGCSAPFGLGASSTLTVAIGVKPDTLDPAAQTTTPISQIVNMIVERLVTLDQEGAVRPLLATSWHESGDRRTWTFRIRSGVHFQDGEPLTSAAVQQSFQRLLDPKTPGARPGTLDVISSVVAVNASEVRFRLRRPFTPFLQALTSPQAGILAPAALRQVAKHRGHLGTPVGTGPYRLAGEGPDYVSLRRNGDYWGAAPAYDRQIFRVVPQDSERGVLLRDGQVDVALSPPPADLEALASPTVGYQVLAEPSDRTLGIAIDTQDPNVAQLRDPTVRQALNHAVDLQSIVTGLMAGTATPAQSPLSPVAFGWCSTGTFTYDPALAQSMLQSAGAQSMHLTLAAPEGRDAADTTVAQAVAGDLEAIGLRVTVTVEPSWPRYLQQITSSAGNASDLALLGWAPASTDGTEGLAAFTRAGWPPAGLGFSRFDDPTADQLIARAASATGRANRQQALCQASRIIWQAAPAIFLCSRQLTAVAQKGVSGLHTQPDDALVTTWATPG